MDKIAKAKIITKKYINKIVFNLKKVKILFCRYTFIKAM
jgi:hypothetical protein